MNLYFRNTGNTTWGLATNWSQSNGGPGDGAIPTAVDAVFFTSLSGNCNFTTTAVCLSFNCTGYTGTLSGATSLTVSGDVIFSSTMTNSWTGPLSINASGTITTNGKNLLGSLTLSAASHTITNDFSIVGTLSLGTVAKVINGGTITMTGTTATFSVGVITSGTATFKISATIVTWSGASAMGNNVIIDTTGTLTLTAGANRCDGNFTYVRGTVVTTGNTMTFGGANQQINSGAIVWNNLTFSATSTYTLLSDINLTGIWLSTSGSRTLNGFTVFTSGLNVSAASTTVSGTTKFVLNGTGTLSTASSTAILSCDLTINTNGTVTIGTNCCLAGTFTYVKGTVVTTGSTMIFAGANQTINTGSIVFVNIQLNGTVLTLSNNITATGNLNCSTVGGAKTINGFTLFVGGGLVVSIATGGTTNIVLNGTGNWSGASTIAFGNNFTIDTTGTITLISNVGIGGITFTYVKGTVVPGSNGLYILGGVTFSGAWNNVTWNTLAFSTGTYTCTLNSDMNCASFQITGAQTKTSIGYRILTNSLVGTSGTIIGTTELVVSGAGGTWGSTTGQFAVPITINCSGTFTFTTINRIGSVAALPNNTVFKYVAGTINQAGFALTLYGDVTFDTSNVQLDLILFGASAILAINVTLLSTLKANTFSLVTGMTCTFLGPAGFIVGSLITQWQTSTATLALTPNIAYRITSSINITQNSTNDGVIYGHIIKSTIAGTKATLTLDIGGTCVIGYITIQDIDASGGKGLGIWQGVINNCSNVYAVTDPVVTLSKSFAA